MSKNFINPKRLWVGSFVPNWLMERPELSPGAKLTYARLSLHVNDESNTAYPKQEILAAELGIKTDRQARRYISELIEHGLIVSVQRGLGRANEYGFLWHEWMDGAKARKAKS